MSSNPDFYKPDELKYHGHRLQRGYTQINFFDEDKPSQTDASPHELTNECHGHWKTPRECSVEKHDCEYFISWQTAGKGDEIKFHIETNNTNTWTGVAFSDNQQMVISNDPTMTRSHFNELCYYLFSRKPMQSSAGTINATEDRS